MDKIFIVTVLAAPAFPFDFYETKKIETRTFGSSCAEVARNFSAAFPEHRIIKVEEKVA